MHYCNKKKAYFIPNHSVQYHLFNAKERDLLESMVDMIYSSSSSSAASPLPAAALFLLTRPARPPP
jgi:hypothetical protein